MSRWVWLYVRKYRFAMLAGLLMAIVVSALNMVNPTVAGAIVDRVIKGGEKSILPGLIALMVSTTVAKCLIRYAYQMIFEHVSQNVIRSIREDLYDKVQGLDFSWYDRSRSGDVMTLMTGDLDAVRHFIAWVIYMTFENVLVFAFSIAVLASINLKFTLMLLAVTPFIALAAVKFSKLIKPTHLRVRDQFARLNTVVSENIAGNRVVKAFVREGYETDRFMAENARYRDRMIESVDTRARYVPLIDALTALLPVVLILAGGIMIIRGELTLGELVTFNGLMWALSNPLNQIGGLVNDSQRFAASADRLFELWSRESAVVDAPNPVDLGRARGTVEFRGVSFDYGSGPVLKRVSFVAESGMTVGILGPTGSGKSTLAKLIGRFYDCADGSVLVDGHDVRTVKLESLRRNVALTMQDVFLFSDTIEGNIAFGRPEATDADVREAAIAACADDFIDGMPEGYDTIVGERGVGLSGGQRQRIALARLMLVNSPVIVLDDTTSSVDAETEERIRDSIARRAGGRTVFVITHRVASIAGADLILVMRDGEIADRGTHAELVARDGYYREVWYHQSGAEAPEGER
jgi:ATP-binding cassette, subfamily B, multidrug efflux pump